MEPSVRPSNRTGSDPIIVCPNVGGQGIEVLSCCPVPGPAEYAKVQRAQASLVLKPSRIELRPRTRKHKRSKRLMKGGVALTFVSHSCHKILDEGSRKAV